MADANLDALFDSGKSPRPSRRMGKMLPCDVCGTLHYRKRTLLPRETPPKRLHPTYGKIFCSKACKVALQSQALVRKACLNCAVSIERPRSLMRASAFCSRRCRAEHKLDHVGCCWPGCNQTVPCRTMARKRRGEIFTEYKIELTKTGTYSQFILCQDHRSKLLKYTGRTGRFTNGRVKLLMDPDVAYDVRAASSKFLRAVVFDRANECCEKCGTPLAFNAPMNTWHIDHRVPMYRGGPTSLSNLQLLCRSCHDEKTAIEKGDAARERHKLTKLHRWMTHRQKDDLIARLRTRLELLGASTD